MWCFRVYGQRGKLEKESEFIYTTDESAKEAARAYIKANVPRDGGEVWNFTTCKQPVG